MEAAVKVMRKIEREAKARANAKPVRYGSMAAGDYHRQGDIYIRRISNIPIGAALADNPSAQLAPGETQGSRHCLDSLESVSIYTRMDATPLDGPLIEVLREFTVTHPEHGHVTLPPGCYAVTFQRQHAEELRRVAD